MLDFWIGARADSFHAIVLYGMHLRYYSKAVGANLWVAHIECQFIGKIAYGIKGGIV